MEWGAPVRGGKTRGEVVVSQSLALVSALGAALVPASSASLAAFIPGIALLEVPPGMQEPLGDTTMHWLCCDMMGGAAKTSYQSVLSKSL